MIDNRRGRYPASPFFRMKRSLIFLFIFISTMLFAGGAEEETRIGVAIYDFDDSFITEVRNVITELSAEGIPVTVCDAEGKQQKQNSEIEDFIDKGYDAIIVNSVDRTASGVIIEKCRRSDVPLVFFNREPVREDMARWEKVYYVGSHAEDAGTIAADILAEYWFSHPSADKNGVSHWKNSMKAPENGRKIRAMMSCLISSTDPVSRLKLYLRTMMTWHWVQ